MAFEEQITESDVNLLLNEYIFPAAFSLLAPINPSEALIDDIRERVFSLPYLYKLTITQAVGVISDVVGAQINIFKQTIERLQGKQPEFKAFRYPYWQ